MASRRKNVDEDQTGQEQQAAGWGGGRAQYDEAIDAIAAGTKKLTDAGIGGASAGAIAHQVWCKVAGGGHEQYGSANANEAATE